MDKEATVDSAIVPVEVAEVTTDEPKLTRREALEVGSNLVEMDKPEVARAPDGTFAPRETNVQAKGGAQKAPTENISATTLQPPAEYTKEEKEDFLALDRKGQERDLRLYGKNQNLRAEGQRLINESKNKEKELSWATNLATQVQDHMRSKGGKAATQEDLLNALEAVNAIAGANNASSVLEVMKLKVKGFKVSPELEAAIAGQNKSEVSPELKALQEEMKGIKDERQREKIAQDAATLNKEYISFEAEKNGAGQPRFPDLAVNTADSARLASQIGSLVNGQTALSQQFIADCQARIPGLTYQQLLREAYLIRGGKIAEAEAPKPEDPKKHLIRSNRAASSVPGRGLNGVAVTGIVKKVSRREALERAAAELEGE